MNLTKHFQQRMSQRGIEQRLVNIVMEYGEQSGDKVTLSRRACQKIIEEVDRFKKDCCLLLKKGGVTVVKKENALITVYRCE